ncbi:hypothetical protein PQR14_23245 [Paraburkholderia bryophila]|uniref:hypothetical protein n=1 Tax=Paraburkholderia bryophila TaxID=420952 RepID=UPI0038B798FE
MFTRLRLPLFTRVHRMDQSPDRFVRKAEYARMRGWNRSYVAKLLREGRLALSEDETLVDWAATDQLLGVTSDPSKKGVRERWAEHRQERDVRVELRPKTASVTDPPGGSYDPPAGPPSGAPSGSTRGFHYWREQREMELALAAKREREKLDGDLVDARGVRLASEQMARRVRDHLLALPARIHLQVAAETDAMKVMRLLDHEVRDCLQQLATAIPAHPDPEH